MTIKRSLPMLQEFAQVICENQQQVQNATAILTDVLANLVVQDVGDELLAKLEKAIDHLKFTD